MMSKTWNQISQVPARLKKEEKIAVYVLTKSHAMDLVEKVPEAGIYWSDLEKGEKEEIADSFMTGQKRVLITTTAFGTGIDHKKIRVVIHYGGAYGIMEFHQQSGRGGRDSLAAISVIITTNNFRNTLPKPLKVATEEFWRLVDRSDCIRQIISDVVDDSMCTPCLGISGAIPCFNCKG